MRRSFSGKERRTFLFGGEGMKVHKSQFRTIRIYAIFVLNDINNYIMETTTKKRVLDEETRDKVKFITFIIPEFARAFLFGHWWTLHTEDPFWSSLYSTASMIRKNRRPTNISFRKPMPNLWMNPPDCTKNLGGIYTNSFCRS